MFDDEIIGLCFLRDEKAIDKISEKYGAYCKKVAENVLRNSEDAEECFNSALFDFWNCVPPNKPENLRIFLAKITGHINRKDIEKILRWWYIITKTFLFHYLLRKIFYESGVRFQIH